MAHIKKVQVGQTSYLIEPTLYIIPDLSNGVYSASLTDFALDTGVAIQVQFTDTNPADAQLKINDDTKYIYYNGNKIAANTFKTNHTYALVYDGIQWQVVGDIDTDTTYTISTGTENGKIKVTPSSGNAYEVSVYGLGSNAFNSTSYLPLAGGNMSDTINRYYNVEGTPLITLRSNNKKTDIFRIGHATSTTGTYGHYYALRYRGDLNSPNNRLELIYNNGTTDTVAIKINENGIVELPQVNKGSTTKPIYLNNGVITEGTQLEDLAYVDFPSSDKTTTFLRGDGTWQTALTTHQDLSAYAPVASPALTGTPTAPTAANGTNTTQIATTEFVNNTLAYVNAMTFKGTLGTGGTVTTLPDSHKAGDTYRVITTGTYADMYCEVGTLIICITDGTTASDTDWTSVETNEDGSVIGPASSTDTHIAIFDGASGRIIKDSRFTIATSVPSNAVFTDVNVTATANTATTFYLIGASGSSTATGTMIKSKDIWYTSNNTSGDRKSELALGNSTSTSSSGGRYGQIRLYGNVKTYYVTLAPITGLTASHSLTLPNKDGTLMVGTTSTTQNAIAIYSDETGTLANSLATINSDGEITATAFNGPLTGDVSGNADTATGANLTTTTNNIAYYSNTTGTFADGAGVQYLNVNGTKTGKAIGLSITGTAYNAAAELASNTDGVLGFGDPGPQLRFKDGDQQGCILFHRWNNGGSSVSFNFLSDQGGEGAMVRAGDFIANTRIYIGTNTLDTSYNLKVVGATYLNGNTTLDNTTLSSTSNLSKVGESAMWKETASKAMIRMTSVNSWAPMIALKANTGWWTMGHYNANGYYNHLIFGFLADVDDYSVASNAKNHLDYKVRLIPTVYELNDNKTERAFVTAPWASSASVGDSTTPVYIDDDGVATACTAYANASVSHADTADSATSATNDSDGNTINTTYLKKTGGTVTGTLILSRTQDVVLTGTDATQPALIVGGAYSSQHLELDGNEIQSKSNKTTVNTLYLNALGGTVQIGSDGADYLKVAYTSDASSTTSGALQVTGGAGITKKLYVGTGIYTPLISATHTSGATDGLKILYSTTIDFFVGVGTGDQNHGLYDNKASGGAEWILYAGTDNKWKFVGTADALKNFKVTTTSSVGLEITTSVVGYIGSLSKADWNYQQTDGALYGHFYSANWKAEIFQDYRTGQLSVRGKNNGTWQSWRRILDETNAATILGLGSFATISSLSFDDLSSHPTTLSGYGITDVTISNGIITLGSSTITPITSINNHTGSSVTLTAGDLGLSNALHFIGITSTELTDGDTTSTLSPLSGQSDSLSKTTGFVDGDVVIYDSTEFIKIGSKWNAIGDESSWAYRDHTHTASIAKAASGDTSNVTLAFGTKYKVTSGGSEYVFTMPSNPNTNNATRQQVSTTNKNYSLLFSALEVGTATNTSSYSTYRNDSVYVNPSTGIITANGFIGDIAGNADTATKLYTAVNIWGQSFDGSVDIIGDMTDVGPTFSLSSSAGNVFQFFTSTSTAAHGQFGKLSLYSNYDSATIDLNTYTLDVEGAVRFNIGASDSSTDKKFIIYGNSRYLSIGGQGLQAYGASDEAELYIQYHGGNIYFGQKILLTNSTTPILNSSANFTLSTSSSKTLTIRSGSTLYLGTNSSSSIIFQINGSTAAKEVARFNTSGHLVPYITSGTTTSNYQLGISGQRWKALFLGTANSYGDEYTPIYWNNGVPTEVAVVQKYTFSIANGSTTAVIAPTNTNKAKSIVTEIVVNSGIEYLNGPISWEIPTTGTNKDKIVLTTIATSGAVDGYILVSIG